MAGIDFNAIKQAIKTLLAADANLTNARITVEDELVGGMAVKSAAKGWIGIYLEQAIAQEEDQVIAAGATDVVILPFIIDCAGYNARYIEQATEVRDDTLRDVHLALMADRSLGGTVDHSWLESFEFTSARGERGDFLSIGTINWVARAQATT
jgi:hypothetical protein